MFYIISLREATTCDNCGYEMDAGDCARTDDAFVACSRGCAKAIEATYDIPDTDESDKVCSCGDHDCSRPWGHD